MKRNQKNKSAMKWVPVLLVIVLILSLTACGAGSTGNDGTGSGTSSNTAGDTNRDSDDTVTDSAADTDSDSSRDSAAAADSDTDADSDTGSEADSGANSEETADEYLLISSTASYPAYCYISEYTYTLGEDGSAKGKYYTRKVTSEEMNQKAMSLNVYTYDSEGRVTALMQYSNTGSSQVSYEYDESGNQIREVSDYYEIIYEYDTDGNQTKMTYYAGSRLFYSCEYDQNGNLTRYLTYDENGDCDSSIEYEYNEEGETEAQLVYDQESRTTERGEYRYTFDANGNRTGTAVYFGETLSEAYEYDEAGNLTAHIRYDDSGEEIYHLENIYVTAEEYFQGKQETAFDSCDALADYMAEAISGLDGEKILNSMYDGVLAALQTSTGYSVEELAETLNEVFEDSLDDALEDAIWEDCEITWEIQKKQICPTEEFELIMDELQYPQFEEEQVWKLETVIILTSESGETGEAAYSFYAVEEDDRWYILMLDEA